MATHDQDGTLDALFQAALAAARPEARLPARLPAPRPGGRTFVVAAGKAAYAMARGACARLDDPAAIFGVITAPPGHEEPGWTPPAGCQTFIGGHPVPNAASLAAGAAALAGAQALGPDDRLLALISGGGSATLEALVEGVTLADLQARTDALLRSGAPIAAINAERRALSHIKGGGLARAAAPAEAVTYVISDVVGDDPALIASGPTAVDGAADGIHVIARARDALDAAATEAARRGLAVIDLGDAVEGEARDVGAAHARLALKKAGEGWTGVLLSGGETTVTVAHGDGRGGPNTEYLLGLALALDGAPDIRALAADTDGKDGTEANAGARIGPDTLARARAAGIDTAAALARNCAYDVFAALEDLVVTGPTRTNVNDFRAVLVGAR